MAKSYDEKRDAFQRMLAGRLPKAVKAVELLANLARGSDYAWTNAELQSMTDQLDDAVDTVLGAFGIDTGGTDGDISAQAHSSGTAASGSASGRIPDTGRGADLSLDVRSEVKWSYDALRRGDKKLAEDRLRRAVEAILEEENRDA